ncbi:MAG TPA: Asp23/Gls24 family envelope stress response protein [Lacisediminihabitans sp.]|uniref:Asp23/Gls24 family envelope stress response protein n=1 Tax=Lacisediminihabitans sp. TaxID=2787631 RepID=UPI002EDB9FB7
MAKVITPAETTTTTAIASAGAGTTVIVDSVIAKVAGIAAREIPGVYALGGGAARAIGAIRDAINQTDLTQGISVEVGETQVAVDISIVAEYPTPLQTVADNVRSAIYAAIQGLIGMQVTEVNVTINDVHIPSDDDVATTADAKARVQ